MTKEEEEESMDPLENLLPALLQIFLTMGLGWISGSLKMFGQKEARGLGMFVGKFSLPALIFISLASLDLTNIRWSFLLAILISKSIIFSFVLLLDYLLNKNFSRAAIFAIYSTQTNDFGMGLPILTSVFGPGHHLVGLLYLVAPISLLILNPIGFVLLEFGKNKDGQTGGGPLVSLMRVLKGLITNPIVAMTILGVLGNIAFSSNPPPHLTKFLSSMGAAFSALAPFSLGLSMAGKLDGIRGDNIKPIAALVTMKTIVTPMLTYIIVGQVITFVDGAPDQSLSNFSLLLGAFPTALGVASYSSEYNISPDLISAAIVLGTLASAPLMYSIANILTILSESPEALARSDHSWIDCILSIASCFIILTLFLYQSRLFQSNRIPVYFGETASMLWLQSPHLLTTSLLLLTLLSSTACLLDAYIHHPILSLIHLTALHASRLSTVGLALKLLTLAKSSTFLSSRFSTILLLITGPLLSLTTLLLLTANTPSYHSFGIAKYYLNLLVNTVCLLPTAICLFLLGKSKHNSLPSVQMFRHNLLLLAMAAAMFSSIAVALGRILLSGATFLSFPGAFKATLCVEKILSAGQGLLFLAVFGIDLVGQMFAKLASVFHSLEGQGDSEIVMARKESQTSTITIEETIEEAQNEVCDENELNLEDKVVVIQDKKEQLGKSMARKESQTSTITIEESIEEAENEVCD